MNDAKTLPEGFLSAGSNVGIKSRKADFGILTSEGPCIFAACVTQNRSRAACVDRTARVSNSGGSVRAIVVNSGNANALTGAEGAKDDERLASEIADYLDIEVEAVITASTGIIGHRLPIDRMLGGIEPTLRDLSRNANSFAESLMTTDRTVKLFQEECFIAGSRVVIHAVAKGAGMIAPHLATTLCFITTDAEITREALVRALKTSVDHTINQLTVDNEMSTNDQVVALANGWAENERIEADGPSYEIFVEALTALLRNVARAIAEDGEGATKMLEVRVLGASDDSGARTIARSVAGSMLVKAAMYGSDPHAYGRIASAAGSSAARNQVAFDVKKLAVRMQNISVIEHGATIDFDNASLRHKLNEPIVHIEVDLGLGNGVGEAWGCDLSYDYVKINADYAAATRPAADGTVAVNDRLADLGPTLKKKLLIEALKYIDHFKGFRAVIKLGGAAMVDPRLEREFADDVLLLQSVGLRPVVVHGGGPEISRTLERLNIKSEFIDGLRKTDEASMEVVEMVLTGRVNQRLVAALNRHGSRAVGLSGKDGGLLRARRVEKVPDLGLVGEIAGVNVHLIDLLEHEGYVPVVSPVGLGEDGQSYNVNADVAAAELASALRAEKLIFLSDVPGLLEGDRVISEITADQLKMMLDRGDISGGMRPKMDACLRALAAGIRSVHLVDGRVTHNVIAELFTDRGVGTLITSS